MRELKSVMAKIQWRGQWDVIGDRSNEWELEIEIIEDTVVYGGEMLEFKLGGLRSKPFEEGNLVIMKVRLLKDVDVPLSLLSVSQWVCITIWVLAPPRCSTKLSIGPVLCHTHDMRHPGMICGVTMASGWRLLVYLCMDVGTTGNYGSISLWLQTTLEQELPYRHQAQPWAGVQYVRKQC